MNVDGEFLPQGDAAGRRDVTTPQSMHPMTDRATGNPLLEQPIELGVVEHVPADRLVGLLPSQLFKLVAAIDENPHCLVAVQAVVRTVLARFTPVNDATPIFSRILAGDVAGAAQSLRAECRRQRDELACQVASAPDDAIDGIVVQYVPSGLTDGRLLQYASSCALTHTELGLAILRVQSFEMGCGDIRQHPTCRFRTMCVALGIPEVETLDFFSDVSTTTLHPRVTEAAFEKPVFTWSISLFPRMYMPELLGAAITQYAARIPPLMVAVAQRVRGRGHETSAFFDVDPLEDATTRQLDLAVEAAGYLLASVPSEDQAAVAQRIANGAAVYWELGQRWHRSAWAPERKHREAAAAKVVRIMASRREIAAGFHRHVKLGSTWLEELLTPEGFDAERLLGALARSRYVVPGNSAASPFVRDLVALDGPMFRIFSEAEITAISCWIDGLSDVSDDASTAGGKEEDPPISDAPLWRSARAATGEHGPARVEPCLWWKPEGTVRETIQRYAAMPSRAVVRRLLDVEKYPDVRVFAHHFMGECLSKTRRLFHPDTNKQVKLPPEEALNPDFFLLRPYSPDYLEELLASQASLQKKSYDAWSRRRVFASRDQLKEDMAGGVPAGLIDGAWLQYIAASDFLHDLTTCYLYRIYDDELGNGNEREHHGNILRRLLIQLEVEFPDVATSDFCDSATIYSDANCVIALLWLCISLFPRRLRPELLGFNLGIESWGVGGAFRISEATLMHHRLDPLLPRLHNAIDNYGEGHTGWSKEVVQRYLATTFRAGGDKLVQQLWERVWAGYSLWSMRYQLRLDATCGADERPTRRAIALMPS